MLFTTPTNLKLKVFNVLYYHTLVRKKINPLERMKRLKMTGGCVQILLIRGLIITYSIAEMQPLVERLLGG